MHTGQHYDHGMSDVFFEELEIPKPDYHLGIGSGSHGEQTGKMLAKIEQILVIEDPDLVIVYGDTNSTLAGALAAAKLHIPVAHVEAGLRSFDRRMPEEVNRVMTDHISDLLFCPTPTAVENLKAEGIMEGVHLVGDVMADALHFNRERADLQSRILEILGLEPKMYLVLTVHRASNTDSRKAMESILSAVGEAKMQVIFPIHPRTSRRLEEHGLADSLPANVQLLGPLPYLDMLRLMACGWRIITDSGGIQKEAYMLGVPCVTLRDNTEWVETVHDGWNVLVGTDTSSIVMAIRDKKQWGSQSAIYGLGDASSRIVEVLSYQCKLSNRV